MKKRILALVCATVMVIGMSLSVCAAGSASAPAKTTEVLVQGGANGQTFGTDSLEAFASEAGDSAVTALDVASAKRMVSYIKDTYGNGAFIASMYDLNGKTGTVTLKCANVWKGQNVDIIHEKAPNVFEILPATVTADNVYSFTTTSNSPFAVVVLGAAAPKTGEIIAMVAAMAAISGIGAAACAKKAKN